MKNLDTWVEWMVKNPELAEKHYPKLMEGLIERIQNQEPFIGALIIQKIPDHFPKWKTEAEQFFGTKRTKMIQGYIDLINTVLFEYEYPNEIEQKAVESVRAELIEQLEYWKQQIDTRYWLTSFFDELEQTKPEYKGFKRDIQNNGYLRVNVKTDNVKIYIPELAVIFTSKELPARNMDTKTETTIDGWEYLQTYIQGYKEGEQYFETEFKLSPSTLYGANAEPYVRDIHYNFFHVNLPNGNEGWGFVKKAYPFILTHEAIKKFGYYSGVVNKVEEQVKKHPKLFATFDKCDHETTPPPKQTEQEQPNTFCKSMPLSIPKEHFKVLTDKRNKNGQPFLTNQQFDLFINRAFCGNTAIPKQKINKANREKLLVQSLFYEFYNNYCMDYFSTMQCQDIFIKLLTDNFEGWDFQNVKNNFTPKTEKRL